MPLLLLLLLLTLSASAQVVMDLPPSVLMHAPHPVHPAKVGEKTVLVYELHCANWGPESPVAQLEVLDENGRTLQTLGQADLTARQRVVGPLNLPTLASGRQTILFMWVDTPSPPRRLRHRLTFASGKTLEGAATNVTDTRGPLLAPPFPTGGQWVAANGPSNTSGHRRALIPIGGEPCLSQRFAIDWIRVGPDGQSHSGDSSLNANYLCHGVEALAVADATVVGVKDGIPENIPGLDSRAVTIDLETVGGNWVALDLGGGQYAMYAHLIPGSIAVRPGQKVRAGELLGRIGNSGNSTEPHLHFHVADSPSWLGADGLPYRLARFRSYPKEGPGEKATVRVDQLPAENQLVDFER